jgi:hypothetical protein
VIAVASGKNGAFLRELGVIDSVGRPTTGRSMRTLKRGSAQFSIFLLGSSGTRSSQSRRSERRTGMSWWGGTE